MEKVLALPELLEIIFGFLHPKDIENAADVCRGWRDVISSSTSLMKRVTLSVNLESKIDENLFKLPYESFDLIDVYPPRNFNSQVLEFLQHIDQSKIVKICVRLPLRRERKNLLTRIIEKLPGQFDFHITLPNLTHLRLKDHGLASLSRIKCPKLKLLHLKLSRLFSESIWDQYSSDFDAFLKTCGELKHLILEELSPVLTSKLGIQLESLELLGGDERSIHLKPFLESQQASLKYLKLEHKVDYAVSDFIYHEMNLEKLVDHRWTYDEFTEPKAVKIKNLSIKWEDCYAFNQRFAFIQRLLPLCYDLEVFCTNLVEGMELELLHLISQLPKLKHLKLCDWTGYDCGRIELDLEFPQLEELIISDCRAINVIFGCPNLKRLEIGEILPLREIENIIECCRNIEEIVIRMYGCFHLTEEKLEVLKFAASKIKLKCRVVHEKHFKKLVQLKNRLIIDDKTFRHWGIDFDNFSLEPKLLTELYGDID